MNTKNKMVMIVLGVFFLVVFASIYLLQNNVTEEVEDIVVSAPSKTKKAKVGHSIDLVELDEVEEDAEDIVQAERSKVSSTKSKKDVLSEEKSSTRDDIILDN